MTTVHHVNDDTYDTTLPENGIVIVDLSASWCGPCRAYAPILENSASRHPDILHLAVDVDESPNLAARYEVLSVPTTIFIRDRIVVGGFPGVLPTHRLDDLIKQTQDLDMDHVRATLNGKTN